MSKQYYYLVALLFVQFSFAQNSKNGELNRIILSKDSLLFQVGFNQCDIKQFENLLSENLKFYHDKDGFSDKKKFLSDLKNGLCKNPEKRQVKRLLVKESTEIFPLYRNGELYAALHNGEHTFAENGNEPEGIAKFSNLWQLENGEWKLGTSISFDHQPIANRISAKPIFDNVTSIENWLLENKVPTLGLGIIENGKLQKVQVYGKDSKGNPARFNSIFNVASLTKPVTAMVALKLINQGKLALDEPLYSYWIDPDIKNDARYKKLTTRMILSHQSGFPNWRWMNADKKLDFQFEPGTQYQYSGEGMEYLRKALEKKFKKSLQQLADELIFKPLEMRESTYVWNKNLETKSMVANYDQNGLAYKIEPNTISNAADDLLTTVEDYGKFLVHILNGAGLEKSLFDEMVKPQIASSKGKHFGLGLEIYPIENGEIALSHSGADQGVQTLFVLIPKTKQGLLIFTNSDTGAQLYQELLSHFLGKNGQIIFDIETK